MKKIAVLMVVNLVIAATSYAEVFESKFGCKINVPSDWQPVTEETLQRIPDTISTNEALKNADKNLMEKVAAQIRRGQAEFFFHKSSNGADNITISQRAGLVPKEDSDLQKTCARLPAMLSNSYGRPIKVYECSLSRTASRQAVYIEFDGIVDGTRCLQYQIQWSPNFVIMFTASCANDNLDSVKRALDTVVGSVH